MMVLKYESDPGVTEFSQFSFTQFERIDIVESNLPGGRTVERPNKMKQSAFSTPTGTKNSQGLGGRNME